MIAETGKNYLITTDCWFFAPDGRQYRAVFGKVTGIHDDSTTLGIKTNRGSTNWYIEIGNMIVAGCQIHYAIQTDTVCMDPPKRDISHEGELHSKKESGSSIYNTYGALD